MFSFLQSKICRSGTFGRRSLVELLHGAGQAGVRRKRVRHEGDHEELLHSAGQGGSLSERDSAETDREAADGVQESVKTAF